LAAAFFFGSAIKAPRPADRHRFSTELSPDFGIALTWILCPSIDRAKKSNYALGVLALIGYKDANTRWLA
jgi:hypothetical protein